MGPFFSRVVRMLAEELNAACIVAVHDRYVDMPAYPADQGFLDQTVVVPGLPDQHSLGRILRARWRYLDQPPETTDEVLTAGAVASLFARYQELDGNIRSTLLLAHAALQAACDDDVERITERHVAVAVTRFSDGRQGL